MKILNFYQVSKSEESSIPAANTEEAESSPHLPKGGYNIDWDNFDDSINPFETKSKVSIITCYKNNVQTAIQAYLWVLFHCTLQCIMLHIMKINCFLHSQ